MTMILTFVGLFVFIISCFTVGFKSAAKRLGLFIFIGFCVDMLITTLAVAVILVTTI